MTYEMKDLGYPRTPTTARFRVEMEDGSKWDVPVQAIADNRDEYYAASKEDTIASIRSGDLDSEIEDWAENNMNWDEVEAFAVKAEVRSKVNFQDGWVNGEKTVIGKI